MNNPEQVDIHTYAKEISRRLWITKGSRFLASRRLSTKNHLSISSISILSIYTIGVSIIQIVFNSSACKNLNNLYTVFSIILSVFILVLSLLEGSKNYQVRAERLHTNATKLSKLYKDLEYFRACQLENLNLQNSLEGILQKYNDLIENCPENHHTDDYLLFMIQNREEFKKINLSQALFLRLKLFIQDYGLYLSFITLPPILLFWMYQILKCS